jgi:carbonic anhydrase
MTKFLLTLFVVFVTGCSLFHRKNSANDNVVPPKVAPISQKIDNSRASAVEQSLALEDDKHPMRDDLLTNNENLHPATTPAASKEDVKPAMSAQLKKISALAGHETETSKKLDGVDPETALLWLKHGNTRFVKGYLRKDGQTKKDILRVSEKQRPHAIVFASSDSRVPPEIVFDQKLGEIFVIRNLGGALDSSVVSSIEYAMNHLGVRLLVLLGSAGTPSQRLRVIGNLEKIKEALPESSELLNEKLKSGEFEAKTAVYDLKTGQVDFQ